MGCAGRGVLSPGQPGAELVPGWVAAAVGEDPAHFGGGVLPGSLGDGLAYQPSQPRVVKVAGVGAGLGQALRRGDALVAGLGCAGGG